MILAGWITFIGLIWLTAAFWFSVLWLGPALRAASKREK